MTVRRTTAPGSETSIATRPEGTRTETATTAGEIAAAVTAAAVVAAGAKNTLATETGTETAADRVLGHGVAPEAEVVFISHHFTLVMSFIMHIIFSI